MMRVRKHLIKLLSAKTLLFAKAFTLAAFLVVAGTGVNTITVHAQSHEDEADTTKPTLNAAISNEKLTVDAFDESGIKAIYVNDYEFTDVPDGKLSIRLQQFDANYQEFKITALDNAGNMSDEYTLENPYYGAEEVKDLPQDAEQTKPTEAKADVKDYVEVKGDDGSIKLFYTFVTESGKQFYLIIDRTEENEQVHFLTDISENDLLNTTSDSGETLPKNSAALSSDLPVKEAPEPVVEPETEEKVTEPKTETVEESTQEEEVKKPVNEDKPLGSYIVMGVLGAIAIGAAYYIKVVRKKEEFIDEEDEEEDDFDDEMSEEDFDSEDEENEKEKDSFFDDSKEEEIE